MSSHVRWFATIFVQRRPNLAVSMPEWGAATRHGSLTSTPASWTIAVFELMLEPKNWGEMSFQGACYLQHG